VARVVRVPILTYHSMKIDGTAYADNHHVALRADLRTVAGRGFSIRPLRTVVDTWLRGDDEALDRTVALAIDGATDFDFRALSHPRFGPQESILDILRDCADQRDGRSDPPHITSFAVVSPQARAALDASCMVGKGWWSDAWWSDAVASGLMHIGNYSWDHNHDALPATLRESEPYGSFQAIDSPGPADREIRRAADFLGRTAPNPGAGLFAYPYGEANAFLARDYFPAHAGDLGIVAAFTGRAGFLERHADRWQIPRFLCGRDWSSSEDLEALLDFAAEVARPWFAGWHRPVLVSAPPVCAGARPEPGPSPAEPDPASFRDELGFKSRYEMVPGVVARSIKPHRPLAGAEIMDFGCGAGEAALGMALNFGAARVVGVDIGPDPARCLAVARQHLGLHALPPNLSLYRVAPGFLHDPKDRFDVVYSWSVFEHIDQRLLGHVLDMIRTSLKPGGLFFVQIAPLFYSAEGSHLAHKLDEPWVHLSTQHDVLEQLLRQAVPDRAEFDGLWGTYTTLNRISGPELIRRLREHGFEILEKQLFEDKRTPPRELLEVFKEDVLETYQIVLLARPAASPRR
jgi:2-polyprenyl-3-methyl-5-hydroxy-6-metoxy-1,4-benzoquinol methylase